MTRAIFFRGVVAAVCLLVPSVSEAHPIHTTMTAVTFERGALALNLRTFADDFSASVAAFAGKPAPADWSVNASDVDRYLAEHLRLTDASGRRVTLRSCGIRRTRELYLLCVRADAVRDASGWHAENRMLTERHNDQVNIVQVNIGDTRRTLLFTRKSAAQPLLR